MRRWERRDELRGEDERHSPTDHSGVQGTTSDRVCLLDAIEKLQQWAGCKEATKVEIQADLRPGGSFTQKMQIAGKGEYTFSGTYEEIIELRRIVYCASMGPAVIRVTVEFFDEGEGTKVVITQEGFPDPKLGHFVSQGMNESLEKLDELLAVVLKN